MKLFEAVALSLNITPEKLRPSPHAWTGGKRFDESEAFVDRLFVAGRNLQTLGPLNRPGMRYFDEDPVVGLRRFAVWAVSIGWSIPCELVDIATDVNGALSSVEAREEEGTRSEQARSNADPTLKRASQGRGGRKKGSGAIDDAPRLRAMLDLLGKGQALSVHDAARKIAESMPGTSQSRDADIRRLRSKFARAYGTEPLAGKTWGDVAAELTENWRQKA